MKAPRVLGHRLGLLLTGALLFGCTDDKGNSEKSKDIGVDEVVPAGDAVEEPGSVLLARYWAEVNPKSGRLDLFEIKPGNKINRVESVQQAVRYTYSGTAVKDTCTPANNCVPAAGSVRLWTDQTKVSYHPQNTMIPEYGFCRQGGVSYPRGGCPNFPAGSTTCDDDGVFCGPIQIVSNYSYALPNVVIRVRNPSDGPTPVTACHEHGANTSFGRCDAQPNKVDGVNSTITPVISNCAYCYGNATNVDNRQTSLGVNMQGLKSVVLPTNPFNQDHATLNTDMFAMQLASDATAGLILEVRFSVPSFTSTNDVQLRDFASGNCTGASTAATCVIPGTTCAIINGGGFGPPTNCFAQLPGLPTGVCTNTLNIVAMGSTTLPHTGYSVQFPVNGGSYVSASTTFWTDTTLRALVPSGMSVVAGAPRVVTPAGTTPTPTSYTMCATTNSWRSLSNSLPAARVDPAGGVVGSGMSARIVVAGGRGTANDTGGSAANTTYLLPIPASGSDNPSWTTGNTMVAARWGAAYAVHGSDLYAFGGANNGSCLSSGERFDDGTLTWSATAAMPAAVCQARAVVSGQYIIVSGGMTVPWTNGTNDFDLLANTNTYVYDTGTNMWATYNGAGEVDPAQRFAAAATTGSGGVIIGGGDFTDGSAMNAVTTVGGGAPPSFSAQVVTGLTARAGAAVGYVSSGTPRYFLFGGSTSSADVDTAATNQLWTATAAAPGSWSQPAGVGGITPTARAGHVFVAATGGDGTIRVYAIGGHNAGVNVTSVQEYTPAP